MCFIIDVSGYKLQYKHLQSILVIKTKSRKHPFTFNE